MIEITRRLQNIEQTFPVEKIKVNDQPAWPVFRSIVYAKLLGSLLLVFPKHSGTFLRKLKNALFGFLRWFRKYDYIVISNEMERKKIGDVVIDKLAEGLVQQLGYPKVLYIEQVKHSHLKRKEYGKKNVVSYDLIILLAGLYMKLVKPGCRAKLQEESTWNEIMKSNGFDPSFRDALNVFLSKSFIFELAFRFLKPQAVFITDYGQSVVTVAAKRLGVTVVEFQHGIIGEEHPFYHPSKKLDSNYAPDYLFAFGTRDVTYLSHGRYVPYENIVPIGNYYLSLLVNEPQNPEILNLLKGYRHSVCVPTDHATHDFLLEYISSIAPSMPDYIFLIVPRKQDVIKAATAIPVNVTVITRFSFQEIVRHCDFNTSTNSTCCLEALALGARNVLVDSNNVASNYFGNILTDKNYTVFVKQKSDYRGELINMKPISKDDVKASNSNLYMSDYQSHLESAIKRIAKSK